MDVINERDGLIEKVHTRNTEALEHMRKLDYRGAYEKNDELFGFFTYVDESIQEIDDYLSGE